jgi:hypothetical protein
MALALGISLSQTGPQLTAQSQFSPGSASFDTSKNQLSSASTQIAEAMMDPSNTVANSDLLSGGTINVAKFSDTIAGAEALSYGCFTNAYLGRIQRLL